MEDKKAPLEMFEIVKAVVVAEHEKIRYRVEVYQMYSGTEMFFQTFCWAEDEIAGGKRGWVACPSDWSKRADSVEAALRETLLVLSANRAG
jgi:hypothetical protein